MKTKKPKAKRQPPTPKHDPDWAKKVVARMTPAQALAELKSFESFGFRIAPERDTRTAIERMVDEACGVTPKGRK